jgi:hypothetical protein
LNDDSQVGRPPRQCPLSDQVDAQIISATNSIQLEAVFLERLSNRVLEMGTSVYMGFGVELMILGVF